MGVALFDLDRTLLDCNSGRLWVSNEWREGHIGWRDVAWASWHLARYSLGIGEGLEHAFEVAIQHYAGIEEDALRDRTQVWFDALCLPRLRPGAATAMAHHREQGDRLVLATSGTLYSALAADTHWAFDDLICTRMAVEDGVLTGGIEALAYGDHKHTLTAAWAERENVDLQEATFYTDSITDRRLMEAVGRPVAVNPDRPLRQLARAEDWEVVDWGLSS